MICLQQLIKINVIFSFSNWNFLEKQLKTRKVFLTIIALFAPFMVFNIVEFKVFFSGFNCCNYLVFNCCFQIFELFLFRLFMVNWVSSQNFPISMYIKRTSYEVILLLLHSERIESYKKKLIACTLRKTLVNKLKFGAVTIILSIIDKKWKISVLQLIDKQIVNYWQSMIVSDLQFSKF